MYQGKSKHQIEFSYKICAIGMVAIILMVIGMWLSRWTASPATPITTEQWIPTEEDIMWIDSLHNQVKDIEDDVVELNVSVNRIDRKLDKLVEERLEYEDGTYDSIRYYESDELRMWIGADGDTIWE